MEGIDLLRTRPIQGVYSLGKDIEFAERGEQADNSRMSGEKQSNMKEYKWWGLYEQDKIPEDGDLRIVNLPVKVIFQWSDKIVADYDPETNKVLEYKSGYVMNVLPEQYFVYKDEESIFIASTFKKNKTK